MKTGKLFSYKAEQYAQKNQNVFFIKSVQNNGRLTITCERTQVAPKSKNWTNGSNVGAWSLNSRPVFYKNGKVIARPKAH